MSSAVFDYQEEYVHLLKRSSRLFHYCVTPLLFSPQWRQRVIEKTMDCTNIKLETGVTVTPPPDKSEASKSVSLRVCDVSVCNIFKKMLNFVIRILSEIIIILSSALVTLMFWLQIF